MKKLIVLFLTFMTSQAFALDPKKCFKVTHGSGLVKYEFPGYSSIEYMTKKYGTTGGITNYSLQQMTSSVDPSVSSGYTSSSAQFSSSSGECSFYSFKREIKVEYIARNNDSIIQQVSLGRGNHLHSLYYFNSCTQGGYQDFKADLQKNFGRIRMVRDSEALADEIEDMIRNHNVLNQLCDLS